MNANVRPPILLASASPRRLELLRGLGLDPVVHAAHIDETARPGESPGDLVLRLARTKAERVVAERPSPGAAGLVVAADTTVVVDGRVLGKPTDPRDAESMLRALRGRWHEVLTGVWIRRTDTERAAGGVESTRVRFRDYDEAWIRAYVRSGEPMGKAGAYAIQGGGVLLVERIEGSWSNVVGLPLERLPGLTREIGISLRTLLAWDPPEDQSSAASFP